jgi:hypothetical protein
MLRHACYKPIVVLSMQILINRGMHNKINQAITFIWFNLGSWIQLGGITNMVIDSLVPWLECYSPHEWQSNSFYFVSLNKQQQFMFSWWTKAYCHQHWECWLCGVIVVLCNILHNICEIIGTILKLVPTQLVNQFCVIYEHTLHYKTKN